MNRVEPVRKFKKGDIVEDATGNVYTVTSYHLGEETGEPQWYYSIDVFCWVFVPERKLIKFEGE